MVRVALLIVMATAAACVGDDAGAEAEGLGRTVPSAGCDGVVHDVTPPDVLAQIERVAARAWTDDGPTTVAQRGEDRISRASFRIAPDVDDGGGSVTVECTSSCRGSMCGSSVGCDASASGCSSLTCYGGSCTGNCAKKSTYTPTTP